MDVEFFEFFQDRNLETYDIKIDDLDLHIPEPSWHYKPMANWNPFEVIEFLKESCDFCDSNRFSCISGYIFQNLDESHCQTLCSSSIVGSFVYKAKEMHLINEKLKREEVIVFTENDSCDIPALNFEKRNRVGRPKSANTKKKGKRSEKIWEFLINLLSNKNTCPDLIKWENFEEGTFKFVKSHKVAQLWGSRKKNDGMNYEKFSRAMRYYYKRHVLLPVPGKRLVYKFGPSAKGWNCTASI